MFFLENHIPLRLPYSLSDACSTHTAWCLGLLLPFPSAWQAPTQPARAKCKKKQQLLGKAIIRKLRQGTFPYSPPTSRAWSRAHVGIEPCHMIFHGLQVKGPLRAGDLTQCISSTHLDLIPWNYSTGL
jgi:hypothetical protein